MRSLLGGLLVLVAMTAGGIALVALVRGRLGSVRIQTRPQAAWALFGAFVILIAGGAVLPPTDPVATTKSAVTSTPTPSPTPESQPEVTAVATPAPDPLPTAGDRTLPMPTDVQAARVERHTDGDTLAIRALEVGAVLASTSAITVRLLEIDTPETKKPGTPVQCYGPQASARLASLVPVGSKVFVAADVERQDRYGRDLLYLWTDQGVSVNATLVQEGFAKAVLYPPNDRYISQMRLAESRAKAARRGLWAACGKPAPVVKPVAPAPPQAPAPAPAPARGNCDDSYPTVCIPPPPPDLDCGEIDYTNFEVVGDDPHRFDADNDGIGCERN